MVRVDSGRERLQHVFRRAGARAIAASSDLLALAHQDHVALVDPGGQELLRLDAGAGGVMDVALSPDGKWAAAGMLDGTARLWSARSGALVAVLVGHTERVSCVIFSSDSRTLLTGDWAGSALRWNLDDAERPAAVLAAEAEAAWRIRLEDALASGL